MAMKLHTGVNVFRWPSWLARGACIAAVFFSDTGASQLLAITEPPQSENFEGLLVKLPGVAPGDFEQEMAGCAKYRGADARLCQGIILAHFGSRLAVMSKGDEREAQRHPAIEWVKATAKRADEGRKILLGLTKSTPTRYLPWIALAELELEHFQRPDSALRLLRRSETSADIVPGVVAVLEARIAFRSGDTVAAWRAWERAVEDSQAIAHQLLANLTIRCFSDSLREQLAGLSAQQVNQLVASSAGLRMVLQERLGYPTAALPMMVVGRFYRLERDSAGMAVGSLLLGRSGLLPQLGLLQTEFPVNVELSVVNLLDARVVRTSLTQTLATWIPPVQVPRAGESEKVPRDEQFMGFSLNGSKIVMLSRPASGRPDTLSIGMGLRLTLSPGSYAVVLALTQPNGRGYTETYGPIVVPAWPAEGLTVSDLVLGWEGHGNPWRSREHTVFMSPTGIFPSTAELSLFAQLRGLTPDSAYSIQIEVFSGDTKRWEGAPKVTLRFSEIARATATEWKKTIGLQALSAGPYRVRVTFRQGEMQVQREDLVVVVRGP